MNRAYQPHRIASQTTQPAFSSTIVKTPIPIEVLLDICRRPRFADSNGEAYVIDKYLRVLPGAQFDDAGNIWLILPDPQGDPVTTMFSCHTDTVHKAKATGTYKLALREGWLSAAGGGVLGADCGTGIWIMLNMIEAKVPGLYVFHREEECGGHGSIHFAKEKAELLQTISHCIAFDRKGISHVITHQGWSRCCSDEFALALASQLNDGTGFKFAPNDGGTFTDSANYTHLIPECTNLSVGYYDQHTQVECQDLGFVTRLVAKLINIDYAALPAVRDPSVQETLDDDYDDFDWRSYYRQHYGDSLLTDVDMPSAGRTMRTDHIGMINLVSAFPGEVADLLSSNGYDTELLADRLKDYGIPQNEIEELSWG